MERYSKGEINLWDLVNVYQWEFDTAVPEEFPSSKFCPNMRELYYQQGLEYLKNFPGYWITKFNSYQTGYNATLGGEGHKHIDYDAVLDVYAATGNELTTATILHIRTAAVREILRATQTTITPAKSILRQAYGKRTNMLDTNFNIIKSFSSIGEAATYISKTTNKKYETVKGHIARARNNPSSISYGYHWSTSE